MAASLPRTFHARPSRIGLWIGALVAVSAALLALGVAWSSVRLMIRAGGGVVIGLGFLAIWRAKRVRSVTVEAGAVLLDARRFPTAGARVTSLRTQVVGVIARRSFWVALPDGSGGQVKRGFTSYLWREVAELHAALREAGVEEGMPFPE